MDESILLVQDEPALVATLSDRLRSEGYQVEAAGDGLSALDRASNAGFHLIILDMVLPRRSGLDVCRDLRQRGVDTPIMMLTARSQTVEKVLGLKIGADDYLTKPFEMLELLARVEALLRRASRSPNGRAVQQIGDVRVDLRRAEVLRDGQPVLLAAREFQLLRYFIEHRGATLSRQELLKEVWGYAGAPSTRTVDVHVAGLRQKLEPDPRHPRLILTMLGLGYKCV
jgi:two-component system, OmpR family, alkaline phosphatase synthesis response regulator PhoP